MIRPAIRAGCMLAALLVLTSCRNSVSPAPKPAAHTESSPIAAQPAEKPPAETASPLRPRFAVQAAAFDQRDPAEKLAAQLSDEFGYQTMVAPVELNGKTLYRVRMLVRTKQEADNLADALASKAKVKAWIDPLP
ncbi:MAG TPA: SPOR domain-containing protein [Terriglobia bacterium]|nr:SPOR domain-containing protein [Terriglobia bacterium]